MDALSFVAESNGDEIAVKISGPSYELNIRFRSSEIENLRKLPSAPWERGAICAGTSANATVFWSCDDGEVFVAVGHDDQSWDFGVSFPVAELTKMLAEIERVTLR